MKLGALTARIPDAELHGDRNVEVRRVVYDSRSVRYGDLFCALKGEHVDGNKFIEQAVKNGAVAILSSQSGLEPGIPVIEVLNDRRAMAYAAHALFNDPTFRVKIYGVTGTNGKTTSVFILQSIFKTAGFRVARIGTLGWEFEGESESLNRTTPEAPDILEIINRLAAKGATHIVMEVTSIAVEQHRVAGFRFAAGWFTNLSQDHLDFHGTMENYFQAKWKFFDKLDDDAMAASHIGDPYGERMLENIKAIPVTFAFDKGCNIWAERVEVSPSGTRLRVGGDYDIFEVVSPLLGDFNDENVLGAVAVALESGISINAIQDGIKNIPQVRGRMELLPLEGNVHAIIDYSHTPQAIERALKATRPATKGSLVIVCGAGGDRDKTKRPVMGRIAADLADKVIVTSDNPRTEDPETIVKEVLEGAKGDHVRAITDRREAINTAISEAQDGDIIIVAGKGHEDYQEINNVKHHFDDREEVLAVRPLAGELS